MALPPHRQLIWFLETAQDCLQEAIDADARLGVLPHWAQSAVRAMADELAELLDRIGRESAALTPLRDEEIEAIDED